MGKNYYLVDYENVQKAGLHGMENLKRRDAVCIFYSEHANAVPIDTYFGCVGNTRAFVQYFMVKTAGKNALDLQLSTYISYLIALGGRNDHFYIVSKDKGYHNVQDFWRKHGIKIQMIPSITPQDKASDGIPRRAEILNVLSVAEITDAEKKHAAELVRRQFEIGAPQLSILKTHIHSALSRSFPPDKTKVIYDAVMPLIR